MRPNTGQYEPRCGWRAAGEVSFANNPLALARRTSGPIQPAMPRQGLSLPTTPRLRQLQFAPHSPALVPPPLGITEAREPDFAFSLRQASARSMPHPPAPTLRAHSPPGESAQWACLVRLGAKFSHFPLDFPDRDMIYYHNQLPIPPCGLAPMLGWLRQPMRKGSAI